MSGHLPAVQHASGDDGIEEFQSLLEVFAQVQVGLDRRHAAPGAQLRQVVELLQRDFVHVHPHVGENLDAGLQRGLYLCVHILPKVLPRQTDAHAGHIPFQLLHHIVGRLPPGIGILRIGTHHGLVENGCVLDAAD